MNNPFAISSSALGKDSNIISLVNMELIRQDEGNGVIFKLNDGEFIKLFVLDREILDLVISEETQHLYVLTHEIIYKYNELQSDMKSEQFLTCDGTDFFKKLYITSEFIYVITVSDKILLVDSNNRKLRDITPDLDESDGLEKLYFRDDVLKYAVGWHGLVLEYKRNKWFEIVVPTNRILFSLAEMGGGELVIVGQMGVLLFGQPETLKIIEHDWEKYDIWDVICFSGKIFLLFEIGVFELTKDFEVVPVMGKPQRGSIFFSFKCCGNKLWAVGENHILELNGEEWKEVFSLKT